MNTPPWFKRLSVAIIVIAGIAVILALYTRGGSSDQKWLGQLEERRGARATLGDKTKDLPTISEKSAPNLSSFVQVARERMNLSDEEAAILNEIYLQMVTAREQIELSLVKREVLDRKVVLITIPEYSSEGAKLYSEFIKRLEADFGITRSREISQKLDQSLRAANRGFGVAEQQLLVEDRGTEIQIIHGSGSVITVNNQLNFVEASYTSQLRPGQLLLYEYLAPLFPDSYGQKGGSP